MKVALLGNAESIHAVKWSAGLASRGHEVHLITQDDPAEHPIDERVHVHRLRHSGSLGYFRNVLGLRRLISRITPDVVNAHYATGYGTLMGLARLRVPTVLNVWGSDVSETPHRSPLHREWVRWSLRQPTRVASTSRSMADGASWLLAGRIPDITPFGIDVELFSPQETAPTPHGVIGTVKKLDPVYGIDILLQSFAQLPPTLRLRVAGQGDQESDLRALATKLGVADRVDFLGQLPNPEVPEVLRGLDVFVALSREESFGVAILEALACGTPAVTSDAPGPAEVMRDGVTGFVVPRNDPDAAARALQRLVDDPEMARRMGEAGRRHVMENYSWQHCLEVMEGVYARAIANERN
ncbi:MAG: glycosyltransferase [Propionibacteriaceae bacterium]|nr:glycosyltransferase [Propionibacteriaceae bacterium]